MLNLKRNNDVSRILQMNRKFCLFRFYSLNAPDVEESIRARSSNRGFLDFVSRNATHIFEKTFQIALRTLDYRGCKSVCQQQSVWKGSRRTSTAVRRGRFMRKTHMKASSGKMRFQQTLFKALALLSRLHVVDYDISVWLTSQIKALKHKNQTCRECSACERWCACVCSLHLCGHGSYGGDCKPHSISLWILNIHASAHALYVHPCTPQHGQNALKIYDLNIPAGSSNLSSPAHSGFNYTADCRKRLF